jgi:nicotinamide-nucleotide amidase
MSVTGADVIAAARRAGVTLATAESCTGGMVAAALTDPPGASGAFLWGAVSYANAAKTDLLGVSPDTIEAEGAVSEEVAHEMALGAREASGADIAVAVTGIAGPGGSAAKPEGRVCFGVASGRGVETQTVEFGALGRARVRAAARDHALGLLARATAQAGPAPAPPGP